MTDQLPLIPDPAEPDAEATDAPTRRTYRERRVARAERLRRWADGREAKATTAYEQSRAVADLIPFGQPILAGHHSQRRHERDLARITDAMDASVAHGRMAERHRSRADEIERQADHAIYSDDPDAIERLTKKLADLEAQRARIKAYNASCRKGSPDPSLLDERQRASLASCLTHQPYACKGGAMPGYALTNLSGNINRTRQRLAAMQKETNQ